MHKKFFITCLAASLVLIVSGLAGATTVQRLSLEEMTGKASSIVMGTVRDSHTFWKGRMILTTYTIDVQETIKGPSAGSVEVTTVGGTVGDTTLHVAGMAVFQPGEDAVVFVERSGAFSTVVGLAQGKFTVDHGEVANAVSGLTFPDGKRGRPHRMPLDLFKKQLKSIIHSQP